MICEFHTKLSTVTCDWREASKYSFDRVLTCLLGGTIIVCPTPVFRSSILLSSLSLSLSLLFLCETKKSLYIHSHIYVKRLYSNDLKNTNSTWKGESLRTPFRTHNALS